MRRMTSFVLAAITAIFVLAGFVKGVIGLGLPTVAMGLLALVTTPAQAAALLVVPSFLTNVWQAMGPELTPLVRRLWPMLLGICAAACSPLLAARAPRSAWVPCSRSTVCSA